ncbi:alpha/beta fold hydrolase [uncultured Hydrogenophaga sp.]|uniref:alpha/beta fold hydrolase n=1 Tax=uncultured Hydrogenophaga sp. TaxID=199683 RepID=UPI00259075B8|nr:alpha/beta fold hydrolase [uncultured Hydrogenophaga sp.]
MNARSAVLDDFRFHTGETLGQLGMGFVTLGHPGGEPVLLLHGTGGSASSFLTEAFGGVLFGPGQPLDLARHFVVAPDSLGHGTSAKPSDGLLTGFPRYNYDDMVHAQYRLVTEVLGIRHFRLVMGNSMGGMHAWLWGVKYPGMMDALVPMACQPTAMSGRNWILRRMLGELIRNDADYRHGRYESQPRAAHLASLFFAFATNGGDIALQAAAPTRAAADALLDARLAALPDADANDLIHQWEASGDFDASVGLERITAHVLAINSADDERNPPETGRMARAMERVKHGRCWLIPASTQTCGHGTTWHARWYAQPLAELLDSAPRQ